MVARDFSDIRIVDLGGDVRANPKLSGTKHNVFGIQTGVAIAFLVRRKGQRASAAFSMSRRPELETAEEKLSFLSQAQALDRSPSMTITPDAKANWINQTTNDCRGLAATGQRAKDKAKSQSSHDRAIFKLSSHRPEIESRRVGRTIRSRDAL